MRRVAVWLGWVLAALFFILWFLDGVPTRTVMLRVAGVRCPQSAYHLILASNATLDDALSADDLGEKLHLTQQALRWLKWAAVCSRVDDEPTI